MGAMSTRELPGSIPAIVGTLIMAAILAPFAYAQFGLIGIVVVAAFATAIVVSVCVAAWGAAKLSQQNHLIAGLLASSGIRMVAPFVIAIIIVLGRGRIAPIGTLYYVVPLYLCMLAADVFEWVRATRKVESAGDRSTSPGSNAHREVG
jgi:hypothetical protein